MPRLLLEHSYSAVSTNCHFQMSVGLNGPLSDGGFDLCCGRFASDFGLCGETGLLLVEFSGYLFPDIGGYCARQITELLSICEPFLLIF